ncbi:sulfurtransferase [Psychrobacillus sp. BM2]|uniref:sulfurtransferase n=1 Tax=Psychrobacillus sp. BM2 TaxID=3400421 RepID=UPI003B02B7D9
MTAIITLEAANKKLNNSNVVFLDTQFIFGKSEFGRVYYEQAHIPGAVYFHLDEDLSGSILEHGGRHPIPDSHEFTEKLALAGVNNDSEVIVYDNTGGSTAARLWWLLMYFGHTNCYVLEQPIQKWIEEGYEVTTVIPTPKKGTFSHVINEALAVDMKNVLENVKNEHRLLVDARTEEVYAGIKKTKYKKIGHIPGAVNIFWEQILDKDLRVKKQKDLKQVFEDIPTTKEIVVYCGAGVTACANILALHELGYPNVKLYVGSWGDWSSYKDTPIAVSK